jgi:hypothetical protein
VNQRQPQDKPADEAALMNNSDSMATDEVTARCHYCGRTLPGGLWFARIQRHGRTLEFCRPRCVELFYSTAAASTADFENHYRPTGFMQAAA